jgi:hypothetical protein
LLVVCRESVSKRRHIDEARGYGIPRTTIELGVGKEAYKVSAVAGLHVVPLEMQRDVSKCAGVSVNVEGPYGGRDVLSVFLCLPNLKLKVL